MACFHPLRAFNTYTKTDNGKVRYYVTTQNLDMVKAEDVKKRFGVLPPYGVLRDFVEIPCGRCPGCIEDRANDWAARCVLEMEKTDKPSHFLTLTFDNDQVLKHPEVSKRDLQLFFKRLRKHTGQAFRYLACGEYGSRTKRPHYHAILFGLDLDDLKPFGPNGICTSQTVSKAWPFGFITVQPADFGTCKYVAGYLCKQAPINDGRSSPFLLMSRRPGLGFERLKELIPVMDKTGAVFVQGRPYNFRYAKNLSSWSLDATYELSQDEKAKSARFGGVRKVRELKEFVLKDKLKKRKDL